MRSAGLGAAAAGASSAAARARSAGQHPPPVPGRCWDEEGTGRAAKGGGGQHRQRGRPAAASLPAARPARAPGGTARRSYGARRRQGRTRGAARPRPRRGARQRLARPCHPGAEAAPPQPAAPRPRHGRAALGVPAARPESPRVPRGRRPEDGRGWTASGRGGSRAGQSQDFHPP